MKRVLLGLVMLAGLLSLSPSIHAQESDDQNSHLPECALASDADSEPADAATSADGAGEAKPEWQTLSLTEVNSGAELNVADLEGCVVLFHPMATWCGSCWAHLNTVKEATAQLEPGTYAIFAVSVEAGMPDEMLAGYSEVTEFDFLFAVASPEMMKALDDEFGRSALNPPATPHVYIAPDGTFSELHTGGSSSDDIASNIEALADTETE